jgi:hypothetical protein
MSYRKNLFDCFWNKFESLVFKFESLVFVVQEWCISNAVRAPVWVTLLWRRLGGLETNIEIVTHFFKLIVYYQQMHLMVILFNLKCLKQ